VLQKQSPESSSIRTASANAANRPFGCSRYANRIESQAEAMRWVLGGALGDEIPVPTEISLRPMARCVHLWSSWISRRYRP
jgi:hypothetical protein